MKRIYLDNAATVPLLPAARAAMEPFFTEEWGNPSAGNFVGRRAKSALEASRDAAAGALGVGKYVCFTSGGTESNRIALVRAAAARGRGAHIVTSSAEHSSVLDVCRLLEAFGVETTFVDPDENGVVRPEDVAAAIRDCTALVSVMYANNETGVLQPVGEIARAAHGRGVLFHTDAVQAPDPSLISGCGADMFSVSGHKRGAPKGSGLLYVAEGAGIVRGGSQEYGIRPGTVNAAFAAALAAALKEKPDAERIAALRDRLEKNVLQTIPDVAVNGAGAERVPGISSMTFDGAEAAGILFLLEQNGVDAAAGSACTSSSGPSHVLKAMGLTDRQAYSTVRFSIGAANTEEEIDRTSELLAGIVGKLRSGPRRTAAE